MAERKRIAVLVGERRHEALRMAVGLTILDDEVSVFVMDHELERDAMIEQNLEALRAMGARIFTNVQANPFEQMSTEEVAAAVLDFDIVIPY